MDNRCYIIMPPGESSAYSQGHFNRVYDYIIVPACRAAGYWPTRSGTVKYENPLDVVKDIVDSEVVLCDLSANNADALYGLAVRHSLDLPVVAVKDSKTIVIFGANDFGLLEYDESLRIDTVQKATEVLGDALKKAVENKKERHQLLNRLSIGLPKAPVVETNFVPIELTFEEEKPKEPSLPKISPLPDYVGDPLTEKEIEKLKAGDFLFHLNYGKGKVNTIKNTGKDKLTSIEFESGAKVLMVAVSDYFRKINK
ncbi:MAG TPA: hypothetical protein VGQ59_11310 [Cyclobacteriaceae bacterium]|nr:hypothetical protein [Cyclobacteriaceae bacterium]